MIADLANLELFTGEIIAVDWCKRFHFFVRFTLFKFIKPMRMGWQPMTQKNHAVLICFYTLFSFIFLHILVKGIAWIVANDISEHFLFILHFVTNIFSSSHGALCIWWDYKGLILWVSLFVIAICCSWQIIANPPHHQIHQSPNMKWHFK